MNEEEKKTGDEGGGDSPLKRLSKEEASQFPVISSLRELYLNEESEEEILVIIGGKRIPIYYRELLWPQYNMLIEKVMEDTAENPDKYERIKQERLMKAMIHKVANVSVSSDHEFWIKLTHENGEILRKAFFDNTGEFRISEVMVKNLKEGLKKEMQHTDGGNNR